MDQPKLPTTVGAKIPSHEIANHLDNEETPPHVLHQIAHQQPGPDEYSKIVAHPNASEETLAHIHKGAESMHEAGPAIQQQILAHPNAPKKLVQGEFKALDPKEYHHSHNDTVMHPAIPSADRDRFVQAVMAQHKTSDADDIEESQRHLASDYSRHPDANPKIVKDLAGHRDLEVALNAAASKHVGTAEHQALAARPELKASDAHSLIQNVNHLDSSVLRQLHDRFKDAKASDDWKSYGEKTGEDIKSAVFEHPNAPRELLDAEIRKKPGSANGWSKSDRQRALEHPTTDSDLVSAKALKGDSEAEHAALERGDTDPSVLRSLHDKVGGHNSKKLIQHPNYPEDMQRERLKGSADEARAVVGRKNLSPEILKEAVGNKNQSIAIDALKHKDVTPEVVEAAYKRKAGDVSRAATNHPLASPDMKMNKAKTDPIAAEQVARTTADPDMLASLHEAHPENAELMATLAKHPNTPAKTLSKLVQAEKNLPEGSYGRRRGLEGLAEHPNLSRADRETMMADRPGLAIRNPSLSPSEIDKGLKQVNDDPERRNEKGHFNRDAINHPNLSPETAKDLIQGKYGSMRGDDSIADSISKRPETFTPEVVKAGLDLNPELADKTITHALAQSSHLSTSEVKQYLNRRPPSEQDASQAKSHHEAIISGLLKNPNAPENAAKEALLSDKDMGVHPSSIHEAALQSPNLTNENVRDYYRHKLDDNSFEKHSNGRELKNQIEKRGLIDDALKTAKSPLAVKHLINANDWGGNAEETSRRLGSAIENPDPEVVASAIKAHGNNVTDDFQKDVLDKLANHPNHKISDAAFRHMSPEGQKEYAKLRGAHDPAIIKAFSREALEGQDIHPDMPQEAVQAVLDHPASNKKHFKQAIEHSGDGAQSVLRSIDRDADASRSGKKFSKDTIKELHQAVMDRHPSDRRLMENIATKTKDPEAISRFLNGGDRFPGRTYEALASNDNVKQKDLEGLTRFSGPEASELHGALAAHARTPLKVLQHIVDNYPEHHAAAATSPRAASPKVLKTLASSPDPTVRAELVNNEKVPQGIKDELLKDPKVMLAADSDNVTPEALEPYSKSDDLEMLHTVGKHHKASDETRSNVINSALKHKDENPEKVNRILTDVAERGSKGLDPKVQEKIVDSSPDAAAALLRSSRGDIDPQIGMRALDRYQDHAGKNSILSALYRAKGGGDKDLIHKMIDQTDLNGPDVGDRPASSHLADLLRDGEVDPNHFGQALDKLKSARGDAFAYPEKSENSERSRAGDASLLKALVEHGPESVYTQLMGHPELAGSVIKNPNITQDHFNQALDSYVKNTLPAFSGPKASRTKSDQLFAANSAAEVNEVINHPKMTAEGLEKVYDGIHPQDPVVDQIAKNNRLSPALASKIYNTGGSSEVYSNPALPEGDMKSVLANHFGGKQDRSLSKIAENPKFNLGLLDGIDISKHPADIERIHKKVAQNFEANPKDLERIYDTFPQDSKDVGDIDKFQGMAASLVKNPKTSEALAEKLHKNGWASEQDMYHSPVLGGKMWRAVPGVDKALGVGNEAKFTPQSEKVKSVMDQIPAGGSLDWAQFKNDPETKNLAGNPVIQKMFTSAPKQRLTKDHAESYMKEIPSKDFHVSYQRWNGIQRHNDQDQLVVQINNGESMDKQMANDPALNGLYKYIQAASLNSGHPVTPQSVGWSRVDTSHPDHWMIDEIQSDLGSSISKELDEINKTGESGRMKEFGLNAKDGSKAVHKMTDHMQGWDRAALNHIIELAKKHGVKKVSIQSGQSKTLVNKSKSAEVTNKYDKIYNRMPQEYGFQPDKYDSLPMKDKKSNLMGQPIWTLDLSGKKPGKAK